MYLMLKKRKRQEQLQSSAVRAMGSSSGSSCGASGLVCCRMSCRELLEEFTAAAEIRTGARRTK